MREIILILHDIRSTHNVGSLLRTAEGLGIAHVYFTGYTPYPLSEDDQRLPHIAKRLDFQIHKTALGAEHSIPWSHVENIQHLMRDLRNDGYQLIAIEQDKSAVALSKYNPSQKCAILLGREVEGIDELLLKECDDIVEIPMYGSKESFNVVQAAAIVMYTLRES